MTDIYLQLLDKVMECAVIMISGNSPEALVEAMQAFKQPTTVEIEYTTEDTYLCDYIHIKLNDETIFRLSKPR